MRLNMDEFDLFTKGWWNSLDGLDFDAYPNVAFEQMDKIDDLLDDESLSEHQISSHTNQPVLPSFNGQVLHYDSTLNNLMSSEQFRNHSDLSQSEQLNINCSDCRDNSFDCNIAINSALLHYSEGVYEERPFKCSQCGKKYKFNDNLTQHMQSHIPKYRCNQCDKMFHCRSNLEVHVRSHTGEKPFECGECDKSFSQLCHLQRHHQILHQHLKPYLCTWANCHYAATTKYNVLKHIRAIHFGLSKRAKRPRQQQPNIDDTLDPKQFVRTVIVVSPSKQQ